MTPFEAKGWKATDKFRVFTSEYVPFSVGDVVELDRDDGSRAPFFKRTRDGMVSACYLDDLERIEPQWSGEGLPPVGTVCEVLFTSPDEYYKAKIIAHHEDKAVYLFLNGPKEGLIMQSANGLYKIYRDHYKFRPIRTEREKEIDEMLKVVNSGTQLSLVDAIEQLYDAGYRKQ